MAKPQRPIKPGAPHRWVEYVADEYLKKNEIPEMLVQIGEGAPPIVSLWSDIIFRVRIMEDMEDINYFVDTVYIEYVDCDSAKAEEGEATLTFHQDRGLWATAMNPEWEYRQKVLPIIDRYYYANSLRDYFRTLLISDLLPQTLAIFFSDFRAAKEAWEVKEGCLSPESINEFNRTMYPGIPADSFKELLQFANDSRDHMGFFNRLDRTLQAEILKHCQPIEDPPVYAKAWGDALLEINKWCRNKSGVKEGCRLVRYKLEWRDLPGGDRMDIRSDEGHFSD